MKKVLFILLSLMVVGSMAFGQVAFSGDAKFAAAGWPGFFEDAGEQLMTYDDVRLYVDWKADNFTSGKITFRYKGVGKDNALFSAADVIVDSANFATNLAGFMDLTGITAKLSGGYCDLISGKLATINAFQLARVEYNLAKGYNLRLDVGVPMATFYYGVNFASLKDGKYVTQTAAYYPMLAGVYGSISGVAYELAWGKPGVIDDLGSIFLQVKYGLRLPSKMLLTLAGGVDVDIDGTQNNQLDLAGVMGNNIAGPLGTTKYVAAARFSMPADVIGIGIDAGLDFNGSTEWYWNGTKSVQPWLANAIGFDIQLTHDIISLDGGFVYDLNTLDPTGAYGVAQWYAGIIKNIGKLELRAGYTYFARNDIEGDKDFRFSKDSDVYAYSASTPFANTGAIYVSTYIKF